MISNHNTLCRTCTPETCSSSHIIRAVNRFLCRAHAASADAACQYACQRSAGSRSKLPALIDYTGNTSCITGGVRVRETPSAEEDVKILDVLEEEGKIKVNKEAEQIEGWIPVKVDDQTGYISAEFVNVELELGKAISIEEEEFILHITFHTSGTDFGPFLSLFQNICCGSFVKFSSKLCFTGRLCTNI